MGPDSIKSLMVIRSLCRDQTSLDRGLKTYQKSLINSESPVLISVMKILSEHYLPLGRRDTDRLITIYIMMSTLTNIFRKLLQYYDTPKLHNSDSDSTIIILSLQGT